MGNVQDLSAIVLAGGLGTRLRSVVKDVPKPMATVGGRPFLEHLLGFLAEKGIKRIILATGYKGEVIKSHFGCSWKTLSICYSHETTPLGTGGSLIEAAKKITERQPVFALNGDTFFGINLDKMLMSHRQNKAFITMAMMKNTEQGRYSSFEIGSDGRVLSSKNDKSSLKSGGIYLFSPEAIADLASRKTENLSFEQDITPHYFENSSGFFAHIEDAPFVDIGVPEDYRCAADIIAKSKCRQINHKENSSDP